MKPVIHVKQQLHSLVFTQGVENLCLNKTPGKNVDNSYIYNCQNLEAAKVSFNS